MKLLRDLSLVLLPLAALTAGAMAATPSGAPAQGDRPNLLFILAEDIGPQLGCYGVPLVRTPHLDALATRGVRYTRAFTTAPVCSASRSAIMTGMYQTSIGAHQHRTWPWNKRPLPGGVRTITDYLRGAGYFTANLSGGGGKRAKKENAAGLKITGSDGTGKTDFNFLTEKPFDGNDWNQRTPGQPFFAQISISESHKGDGWTLARSKDSPVGHVDASLVRLPPYYPDHPVAREEYANYLDAIALMDHFVGEVLARLAQDGLAGNTIVVFMGDNGQCLFRSKQFLYDGGIHVPLLITWPDGRRAGAVDDQLISSIDLSAALLGFAGVKPAPVMQGRDFLAPDAISRAHIFAARDRMDESTDRMRAVRTSGWKYIRNYFPAIPYLQHNAYKEKSYPTWGLVKELARTGGLPPEAAPFAAERKPLYRQHPAMAGVILDEPKAFNVDTSPMAVAALGANAPLEAHLGAARDFYSKVCRFAKERWPDKLTILFQKADNHTPAELVAGGGVGPLDYYGCDGRPWTREEDKQFPHGGAVSESGKGKILLSGIGQIFIDTARRVPGRKSFFLAENHNITSAMIDAIDRNYPAALALRPDLFTYYYYPRNVQEPDRAMAVIAKHIKRFTQG